MHPRSQRRIHSAEFKASVLAECQKTGASVAAVALAHGLNVNLVRKWLVGRGLKRSGLAAPRSVSDRRTAEPVAAPALQFVPVELPGPKDAGSLRAAPEDAGSIDIELRRGDTQLSVRWPASQPEICAAWLRELVGTALR